jgi:hypothetical protein
MSTIVIKGINTASISIGSRKVEKRINITLTLYSHGVITLEKSTGDRLILRGHIRGMNLVSPLCHDDDMAEPNYDPYDEEYTIPYDVIEFMLNDNCSTTIACPKETFKTLQKEVFHL